MKSKVFRSNAQKKKSPHFFTIADLAERWMVHPKTAGRWCREGCNNRPALRPVRLGSRILFDSVEVLAWERELPASKRQ